jgi:protein O-GlcNAc transferase
VQTREDFNLPSGKILYLVPQSLYKIHPDNDALILDVLEQEADSVAVLFSSERQPAAMRTAIERLQREFELRGMDTSGRIKILPRLSRNEFLRVNQLCDAMLDTMHWSGGNTSLDAIASGLPIVTLPGRFMRGRQSLAMLKALGCSELVAEDRESYVATALRLGRDKEWRDTISRRIVERRHELFNQTAPVRALEDFFSRVTAPGGSAAFLG